MGASMVTTIDFSIASHSRVSGFSFFGAGGYSVQGPFRGSGYLGFRVARLRGLLLHRLTRSRRARLLVVLSVRLGLSMLGGPGFTVGLSGFPSGPRRNILR